MRRDERGERDAKLLTILALADELATPGTADAAEILFVALHRLAGADGWHKEATHRMWLALNNAGKSGGDGVKIRHAARHVEHAIVLIDAHGDEAVPSHLLANLKQIDSKLAAIARDELVALLARHTRSGKRPVRGQLTTAGVVTEIMMLTRGLGTSAKQDRAAVLARVTEALKVANK